MPPRLNLTPEQFEQRVREQANERKRLQRQRDKAALQAEPGHVMVTGQNAGHVTPAPENGRLSSLGHVTPSPPPDPPFSPALSTKGPPPEEVVARIAARLQAFGRGYKHDQARLEKLIREFPHLDVEEEVADGLDFLDRPENRKRVNSLGFHRNGCKRAEARRVADAQKAQAANGVGSLRGVVTNGTYHPPIAFQHNRRPAGGPDDVPLPGGELMPISKEEFQRTLDANRGLRLEQKVARLNARLKGPVPKGGSQ